MPKQGTSNYLGREHSELGINSTPETDKNLDLSTIAQQYLPNTTIDEDLFENEPYIEENSVIGLDRSVLDEELEYNTSTPRSTLLEYREENVELNNSDMNLSAYTYNTQDNESDPDYEESSSNSDSSAYDTQDNESNNSNEDHSSSNHFSSVSGQNNDFEDTNSNSDPSGNVSNFTAEYSSQGLPSGEEYEHSEVTEYSVVTLSSDSS